MPRRPEGTPEDPPQKEERTRAVYRGTVETNKMLPEKIISGVGLYQEKPDARKTKKLCSPIE